ncbi:UDP-sugar diphosphatase [Mactra antiquata]
MESGTNSIIYTTKCKNLTTPDSVKVKLSKEYNRKLSPTLEEEIESIWKRRLAELPSLFNGTKFRLHSVEEDQSLIILNLGVTCYKDFQGTNLSSDVLVLQSQGLCDHDDSQAYMCDALGVGALVMTSDDHIVLIFRSKNCGEDTEMWDRPGGHAEPTNIVGRIPVEDIDLSSMSEDAVIKEIYQSIIEEVVSEVNLPQDSLQSPVIIGIHRSNLNGGKPNVEFLVRCSLSSSHVESLYKQGIQAEAYESENIMLLPVDTALMLETTQPELWSKMAAGAKGMLTLYRIYRHRFLP